MIARWLMVIVSVAVVAMGGAAAGVRSEELVLLTAGELRCEYLRDPLGVDESTFGGPRLSWTLTSDRRAERQTAYRVLVASSEALLARDEGDLWDSGKVDGAATCQVEYRGKALASRQAC